MSALRKRARCSTRAELRRHWPRRCRDEEPAAQSAPADRRTAAPAAPSAARSRACRAPFGHAGAAESDRVRHRTSSGTSDVSAGAKNSGDRRAGLRQADRQPGRRDAHRRAVDIEHEMGEFALPVHFPSVPTIRLVCSSSPVRLRCCGRMQSRRLVAGLLAAARAGKHGIAKPRRGQAFRSDGSLRNGHRQEVGAAEELGGEAVRRTAVEFAVGPCEQTLPSRMMAILSASVSASVWSWVT